MNTPATFETLRTCDVEVQYLRGTTGGRAGFWITTTCHAERLSGTSFLRADEIPTDDAQVARKVVSFNDETLEGISIKYARVITVGRDDDSALFIVTANVVREARTTKQP